MIVDDDRVKIFDTILSAGRTGLLSAIMTAIVSSVDKVNNVVTNKGLEYCCAGYVKLSGKISLMEARIADMEARIAELGRETEINKLNGIIRDLVEVLCEVLFAMATDLKMPKEVLDRGHMERINLRLFLKHSSKESGVLRQYLLDALELKGISLRDYNILVATTKIQISTSYNCHLSNVALIEILQLTVVRYIPFDEARAVLLHHSTCLMKEDEEDPSY